MMALGLVVNDHYIDDFIGVDVLSGGDSAAEFIQTIVAALGSPRAPGSRIRNPELDPIKYHPLRPTNVVLGVEIISLSSQFSSPQHLKEFLYPVASRGARGICFLVVEWTFRGCSVIESKARPPACL